MIVATAFLLLVAAAAGIDAPSPYVAELRKSGWSLADGNFSAASPGALHAEQHLAPNELLFTVHPRWVQTVRKALGRVTYINKCSDKLPRTLPRSFVLASWVLVERHMGKPHGLWRLWLESLPALDAAILWSDAELAALEDARAVRHIRARREQLQTEYDTMMHVLLSGCGMEDDLPGDVKVCCFLSCLLSCFLNPCGHRTVTCVPSGPCLRVRL